jgi:hypothetical protein
MHIPVKIFVQSNDKDFLESYLLGTARSDILGKFHEGEYISSFASKDARILAVDSFNKCENKDGVGVSVVFNFSIITECCITIHVRNLVIELLDSHISEFLTGNRKIEDKDWKKDDNIKFTACHDALYAELIYKESVMLTNIDDTKILFKDFALLCLEDDEIFCYEQKHDVFSQILGYDPIIEFSPFNDKGIPLDFISLDNRIKYITEEGYFVMKPYFIKEKIETLRKRFTSGKITVILSPNVLESNLKKDPDLISYLDRQNVVLLTDENAQKTNCSRETLCQV